jgi:hypothetical protein
LTSLSKAGKPTHSKTYSEQRFPASSQKEE